MTRPRPASAPSVQKAVVYCGGDFIDSPGNVAFLDCIALLYPNYVAAAMASQERAALVDQVRERFDFVHAKNADKSVVIVADESFVQRKIRRALSDVRCHDRYLKRKRSYEENDTEASKETLRTKPRHHDNDVQSPQASVSKEEALQQSKGKSELDMQAVKTGIPVVYCGSSSFSQGHGNDAYGELVLASRPKYWAVDSTAEDQARIVASIMTAFNFQRPTDATGLQWVTASSAWTRQKVQGAIDDTRYDVEAAAQKAARSRRSSMSPVATWPESVADAPPPAARSKTAAATPNTIHEMLRQCPFLTGKPVVFCSFASWKISPGNVAYANAVTAQRDLYRAADIATRESIVDAIWQRFDFRQKQSLLSSLFSCDQAAGMTADTPTSWLPASSTFVKRKIAKAFGNAARYHQTRIGNETLTSGTTELSKRHSGKDNGEVLATSKASFESAIASRASCLDDIIVIADDDGCPISGAAKSTSWDGAAVAVASVSLEEVPV